MVEGFCLGFRVGPFAPKAPGTPFHCYGRFLHMSTINPLVPCHSLGGAGSAGFSNFVNLDFRKLSGPLAH